MTTPGPAMDDSPTVPRPPGAVETVATVLAARMLRVNERMSGDHGRKFIAPTAMGWLSQELAEALVDAGCVLGDDWVVETRVQWGVQWPSGGVDQFWLREAAEEWRIGRPLPFSTTLVHRTVTTATRTTAWKEEG